MATIPEGYADLLTGTVALSTTNPDGYPQTTAVYTQLQDDGLLHTSVSSLRQKYKNLAARPQATVFVIDPVDAYRTIEVRADVELIPDPGKAWSKAFLPDLDFDTLDPPHAQRFHVVLTPKKVNVYPPAA